MKRAIAPFQSKDGSKDGINKKSGYQPHLTFFWWDEGSSVTVIVDALHEQMVVITCQVLFTAVRICRNATLKKKHSYPGRRTPCRSQTQTFSTSESFGELEAWAPTKIRQFNCESDPMRWVMAVMVNTAVTETALELVPYTVKNTKWFSSVLQPCPFIWLRPGRANIGRRLTWHGPVSFLCNANTPNSRTVISIVSRGVVHDLWPQASLLCSTTA